MTALESFKNCAPEGHMEAPFGAVDDALRRELMKALQDYDFDVLHAYACPEYSHCLVGFAVRTLSLTVRSGNPVLAYMGMVALYLAGADGRDAEAVAAWPLARRACELIGADYGTVVERAAREASFLHAQQLLLLAGQISPSGPVPGYREDPTNVGPMFTRVSHADVEV